MRRLASAAAVALVVGFTMASPAAAASASSWRASISGEHLRGGATTLISSDGRGSVNVKVTGVPAGQPVAVSINLARCPTVGESLFSFLTSPATPAGVATGKGHLSHAQVTAYNAALTARTPLSVLAFTAGDTGCGDQVGAPRVGTARLRDSAAGSWEYDVRYPVVSGIDAAVAARVNAELRGAAERTVAEFIEQATEAGGDPSSGGPSTATQTFSVSLSMPTLLSLVEHYVPEVIGQPHGDEQFLTFTFDLATGRRIELAELFRPGVAYLEVLSREAQPRLERVIGPFAAALTGPNADNFRSWRLAATGLRFTFAQAQGFAVPNATITIPWRALLPVLDPASPIARLLPRS